LRFLTAVNGFELAEILAPSPVENYLMFIHVDSEDDVSPAEREAARKITRKLHATRSQEEYA
jgi:hypothetical protein